MACNGGNLYSAVGRGLPGIPFTRRIYVYFMLGQAKALLFLDVEEDGGWMCVHSTLNTNSILQRLVYI